jgi:hypothetical protein
MNRVAGPASSLPPPVFVMGSTGMTLGNPHDLNSEAADKAMTAHQDTVAGNEALALAGSRVFPRPAYFGLGPGMIKTSIRENLMGRNGSLGYRLLKGSIREFFEPPRTYAAHIVPLLFASDLGGHTGLLFNRKGRLRPHGKGFDTACADRYLALAAELLNRAPTIGHN